MNKQQVMDRIISLHYKLCLRDAVRDIVSSLGSVVVGKEEFAFVEKSSEAGKVGKPPMYLGILE